MRNMENVHSGYPQHLTNKNYCAVFVAAVVSVYVLMLTVVFAVSELGPILTVVVRFAFVAVMDDDPWISIFPAIVQPSAFSSVV